MNKIWASVSWGDVYSPLLCLPLPDPIWVSPLGPSAANQNRPRLVLASPASSVLCFGWCMAGGTQGSVWLATNRLWVEVEDFVSKTTLYLRVRNMLTWRFWLRSIEDKGLAPKKLNITETRTETVEWRWSQKSGFFLRDPNPMIGFLERWPDDQPLVALYYRRILVSRADQVIFSSDNVLKKLNLMPRVVLADAGLTVLKSPFL